MLSGLLSLASIPRSSSPQESEYESVLSFFCFCLSSLESETCLISSFLLSSILFSTGVFLGGAADLTSNGFDFLAAGFEKTSSSTSNISAVAGGLAGSS